MVVHCMPFTQTDVCYFNLGTCESAPGINLLFALPAGCADTVDIGETAYAKVLADDVDGTGKLDLILATMNGNVYCFQTGARYHPLKAWPSEVRPGGPLPVNAVSCPSAHSFAGGSRQAGRGAVVQVLARDEFTARYDWEGVYAVASSRVPRDVRGQKLSVRFEIIDKRPPIIRPDSAAHNTSRGPYRVSVALQVGLKLLLPWHFFSHSRFILEYYNMCRDSRQGC
jgi:hypothetical protein